MSLGRRAAVAAAIAAIYAVPYAGYALYPLLLAATVVHELAHGVAALVTGGEVGAIALAPDGGAATVHAGGAIAVIAAAGPLAPAVIGAALLAVAGRPRARRGALLGLAAAIALGAALWLRGGFALACGLGAAGGFAALGLAGDRVARLATVVVGLGVGLAWLARREELFALTAATPHGRIPTDVQTLAAAAGGPPSTWAWVVIAASLALVAGGLALGAARPRPDDPRPRSRVSGGGPTGA
ncbi:MAG: M50 family metallopeptidase [Myxococcales bacterium]|nr:M50 family metallopeptidase [Myxococcales bacterium]